MKALFKQFVGRDAHPFVQFLKYGIAGVVATVVDVGIFYFLSLVIFPAIAPDDTLIVAANALYEWGGRLCGELRGSSWFYDLLHFEVEPLSKSFRERNFLINKCIVFAVSNMVAYLLNMLWVFQPGKHTRRKEVALFYAVAISSFVVGTGLGWALIHFLHMDTTQARIADIVAAVMINFFCRKHLVFKG